MAPVSHTWTPKSKQKRYCFWTLVVFIFLALGNYAFAQDTPEINDEEGLVESDIVTERNARENDIVDEGESESRLGQDDQDKHLKPEKDFYSFSVTDIEGSEKSLEVFRGKVVLVVNVASECGYTDGHYRTLVQLQKELGSQGKFTVLGFPCNQFGAQEPADNASILRFALKNYNVNFPIFAKINVLDNHVPDAWKYLIEKSGNAPNWNFWKYLVDPDGHVVSAWGPWISVEEIKPFILSLYNKNLNSQHPHGGEL